MATTPALPRVTDTSECDMTHFKVYEKAIRKVVDKKQIPGYCSMVLYKGKVLHSDAYGYADPERRLKYGPDTLVRLYCMMKPFVSVALIILQERRKLSLRDPVAKYIPSFRGASVVSSSNAVFACASKKPKPFTILQCLTHTAGFGYGNTFNEECDTPEAKMLKELTDRTERNEIKNAAEFVEELAKLPLRYTPGTRYNYSHSYEVLGRVIEVVSGMPLGKFLEKEIFRPLKMRDTAFSFPRHKAHRLAAIYVNRKSAMGLGAKPSELPKGKKALCRIDGKRPLQSRWLKGQESKVEAGGGFVGANWSGCVSTLNDSARFFAMLSNGGVLDGVRIIKEKSVKEYIFKDLLLETITTGKRQKDGDKPYGWSAIGELAIPRGPRDPPLNELTDDFEVGETGGGGAACTFWSVNPNRDYAILWFTQSMDNSPYDKPNENIFIQTRRAIPFSRHADPEVRKMVDASSAAARKRKRSEEEPSAQKSRKASKKGSV